MGEEEGERIAQQSVSPTSKSRSRRRAFEGSFVGVPKGNTVEPLILNTAGRGATVVTCRYDDEVQLEAFDGRKMRDNTARMQWIN